VDCVALTAIVLMQEGASNGLGAISGMADSYWGKNKGRSVEGTLETITKVLAVVFVLLSFVLNIV
jgi:preprotein translocase subunit SecG